MTDNVFVFRFGASVGAALKAFNVDFLQVHIPTLEIQTFSEWLIPFAIKLGEVAITGVVAGFFGLVGKRIYDRFCKPKETEESGA